MNLPRRPPIPALTPLVRNWVQIEFQSDPHVDLEYTWAGVVAISLNDTPFFGRLAPNVFGAAVYNGVGMAMGAASGMLLADEAIGAESELLRDVRSLPRPAWPPPPPPPLLGLGVRPALAWMHRRAGAEL